AEELPHLPSPRLEVRAQDRRLLGVGDLLDAHGLGLAAEPQPGLATDADVAHPLRFATRCDQVAPAFERQRVHRRAVPLARLATANLEHARALEAEPEG